MDEAQRIDELEARIAHQDQSISELSDELFRQQKQIALLEGQTRQLHQRLQALGGGAESADPADEKPPHY